MVGLESAGHGERGCHMDLEKGTLVLVLGGLPKQCSGDSGLNGGFSANQTTGSMKGAKDEMLFKSCGAGDA